MRKGENCGTCAAWCASGLPPAGSAPQLGNCRRHAPASNRFADTGGLFPIIAADGWCLEFVPAPLGIPLGEVPHE